MFEYVFEFELSGHGSRRVEVTVAFLAAVVALVALKKNEWW